MEDAFGHSIRIFSKMMNKTLRVIVFIRFSLNIYAIRNQTRKFSIRLRFLQAILNLNKNNKEFFVY